MSSRPQTKRDVRFRMVSETSLRPMAILAEVTRMLFKLKLIAGLRVA